MSRFKSGISILFVCIFSLFASMNVLAQETTTTTVVQVPGEQPMIVTTTPAPKETVVVPQGYVNCITLPAGWSANNVWVPERKVCQYAPKTGTATEGVAWVDGYWACTEYKATECTKWDWRAGHWVKTLEIY